MKKELSIVRVDTRHYRTIARENWGLTREQMKGKHVHHRIAVSDGGTNDPTNLYVCSPWFHDVMWHGGSGGFIELAAEGGKKAHKERDENGKSIHALRALEKLHSRRDELGRSIIGVQTMEKVHAEKDEQGRSVVGVANAKRMHAEKNEQGKSVNAVKAATATNAAKDENGKSINALKGLRVIHSEKDERGKSVAGVRYAQRMHAEKDENGKSVSSLKGLKVIHADKDESGKSRVAVKAGLIANSTKWKSTIDGFVSSASGVARHNRTRGWDPMARVRVG